MKPIAPEQYYSFYDETPTQKILKVFFDFPEKEFSLTDLARIAKVSKSNVGKSLRLLDEQQLVRITRLSTILRIRADTLSVWFNKCKRAYNIRRIYETNLIDHLIHRYGGLRCIILFGSFAKGEDLSSSDIDIAIEIEPWKHTKKESIIEDITEYTEILGKKIQVHLFNRKIVDKNVFRNIANGIRLFGHLEVNP